MPVDMSTETTTPTDAPAPETTAATTPATGEPVHEESLTALPGPEEHAALTEHVEDAEAGEGADLAPTEAAQPESPEAGDQAAEPAAGATEATGEPAPPPSDSKKKWYVVKVQSGREESIKAAVERKVKIEGLEEFYGQIAIPVEEFVEKKKVNVKDKKTGQKVTQEKNVIKYRKKFPGYLFAEVEFNDRILYLFRETSGVGDFVGATGPMKPPTPMSDREVQSMLVGVVSKEAGKAGSGRPIKVKLDFEKGDKVRIKDGAFAGSEAEVKSITVPKDPTDTPKVTVVVTIWGRPVEMEMDYWHVDKV